MWRKHKQQEGHRHSTSTHKMGGANMTLHLVTCLRGAGTRTRAKHMRKETTKRRRLKNRQDTRRKHLQTEQNDSTNNNQDT